MMCGSKKKQTYLRKHRGEKNPTAIEQPKYTNSSSLKPPAKKTIFTNQFISFDKCLITHIRKKHQLYRKWEFKPPNKFLKRFRLLAVVLLFCVYKDIILLFFIIMRGVQPLDLHQDQPLWPWYDNYMCKFPKVFLQKGTYKLSMLRSRFLYTSRFCNRIFVLEFA